MLGGHDTNQDRMVTKWPKNSNKLVTERPQKGHRKVQEWSQKGHRKVTMAIEQFPQFSQKAERGKKVLDPSHCILISNIPAFNLLDWNWNDINCDMQTVSQFRFRPLCKVNN